MTVKELIEELQKHPETMDVYFYQPDAEFEYGMVNVANQEKINFKESKGGISMAEETVLVLDEKY